MAGYLLGAGLAIDAKAVVRDDEMDPPMVFTALQPIHLAWISPEVIPFLIQKGATIHAATGEGWQPIHLAAAFGEVAALRALIAHGGDPKAKTRDGKTALQLATEFENAETAAFLRDLP
jgi:ankyrin repeat protein